MPNIRIGFASDFTLKNGIVGIGSTTGSGGKLDVDGVAKANYKITGVATLTSYGGFIGQKQHISEPSTIGFATVGLQTAQAAQGVGATHVPNQYYETEIGFTDLGGVHHGDDQYFNTLSEDLVIDDGQILNITNTEMVGVTTIGEYDPHTHASHVCAGSLEQVSVTGHFSVPCGGINERKENPVEGTVRFNYDLNTLEFFNGVEWRQFTYNQGQSGRGVYGGGESPGQTDQIDYLNLTSSGNAINFGDLTDARFQLAAASSSIRGLFAGGDPGPSNSDVIDYITIASAGNAFDFGDLDTAGRISGGASSSTRAIFAGENKTNVITYVEIATTGDAVDFGQLTDASGDKGIAASSPTRFVYASGNSTNPQIIEYGTISSRGNTITFGDLNYGGSAFRLPKATSNGIRGIFAGGYETASPNAGMKQICYITMATTGNAVEFGELTATRQRQNCVSSQIKSFHIGGESDASGSGTMYESIDVIIYASGGSATDFGGNTNGETRNGAGFSDSHGGLGGY